MHFNLILVQFRFIFSELKMPKKTVISKNSKAESNGK